MGFKTDKVSDFQGTTDGFKGSKTAAPAKDAWATRSIDLRMAYQNYVDAQTSEDRLARGEELQAVLKDQLEVEAAYERFLQLVYPDDAQKQQTIRDASAPADQKEC